MRNRTVVLIALLFLGLVIGPGFSMSSDGSEKPTMGCGKTKADLDDWLDGDNVAHVYFHQVDELFEGKNDGEAWAKMSYTYCGTPTKFVFNGHGLEREELYELIAMLRIPEGMMMPQPEPEILGEAMSNGGGNVHIKGPLPAEEAVWDLYLVRAGKWEKVILEADEPIAWSGECDVYGVCDQGVLFAELSGDAEIPPVMTEASGNAIFYESGGGDQLAFILQASYIGTVIGAHIHNGAIGANGPAVATLFTGSDGSGDFLIAGMVMESGLMGDFAGSPMSALIAAMDEGMTYVNVHTETWPAGEIRGQIGRIDIGGFCDDNDDDCEPAVDTDDPYYERFEGISLDNSCETDDDCIVEGCSSEVCAAEPAITTCESLPYQPEGGCLCVEGVCQWTTCSE
jgi:eight-cysteine-cluster-containing protein